MGSSNDQERYSKNALFKKCLIQKSFPYDQE